MKHTLALLFWALGLLSLSAQPAFVANDTLVGTNMFQVEFAPDGTAMVWCSQLPGVGGFAEVFYAPMDADAGWPVFAETQLVDTIQSTGWPYWGTDSTGLCFVLLNQHDSVVRVRVQPGHVLVKDAQLLPFGPQASLLNVSRTTLPNLWVSYLRSVGAIDSLIVFDLNAPNTPPVTIAHEPLSGGTSLYGITFPRWVEGTPLLLFPFVVQPPQPVAGIRFWNAANQLASTVSNDFPKSHVDDLAFLHQGDTLLFTSRNFKYLDFLQMGPQGVFEPVSSTVPATDLDTSAGYRLSSFEPFVFSNTLYGAYQLWEGQGFPGETAGEIWLTRPDSTAWRVKLTPDTRVTVDPEYYLATDSVYIFYYGRPAINPLAQFNLYRCSTPLGQPVSAVQEDFQHRIPLMLYPNPANHTFSLALNTVGLATVQVLNLQGAVVAEYKNYTTGTLLSTSGLGAGLYSIRMVETGQIAHLVVLSHN